MLVTNCMNKQIKVLVLLYISIPLFPLSSCINKNAQLPELRTEAITAITQTTAISGGKIIDDGGAEISAKGICWGINNNPTLSDHYTSAGSGGADFMSTLSGLTPKTEYHVRAFAENNEGTAYGDDKTFRTLSSIPAGQIIADHNVVDKYDDIPQYYINEIKKMWVSYAGESHSGATRAGLLSLALLSSAYSVSIVETGAPDAYTTSHLRFSRATWGDYGHATGWIYSYGEEDWFTSATAISRTKAGFTYCNTHGLELAAIGFGWCYDYEANFADYIDATQAYVDYCSTYGYKTKVFFTTAPMLNNLYQE